MRKDYDYSYEWHSSWQGGGRAQRGDITAVILELLSEEDMHGYEIMRRLEERSHGMWRPSAGSVYPTLQLLEDQELVTSREDGGKKIYTLTEKGKLEAKRSRSEHPWESRRRSAQRYKELSIIIHEIVHDLKRVAMRGSDDVVDQLRDLLLDLRERIRHL